MTLSEGDFLVIGAFCHTVSFFPIFPPRSTFPTSNFFLCLQVRIVGGLFLSSQRYDSLFSHLLEINNRRKPPWILNYINHSPVSLFFSHFPDSYRQKSVSTMGDKLRKSVQDLTLGIDDAPTALPSEIVSRATSINRFTLVITTVNPRKQNLSALIGQMPWVWGLVDACVGRILSPGTVQFKFRNEEPMNLVLHRGLWSFHDWMLTIHRWYLTITEEERKIIPFWVRISGIPTLYLINVMARFVGSRIGPETEVDFEENVNNTGFVRVQMDWKEEEFGFLLKIEEASTSPRWPLDLWDWVLVYLGLQVDSKNGTSDFKKRKHLPWQQIWVIRQRRLPTDQRESYPESSNVLLSMKRQDTVLSSTTLSSHFKSKVMLKAFWSLSSKLIANNKYVKEVHNR